MSVIKPFSTHSLCILIYFLTAFAGCAENNPQPLFKGAKMKYPYSDDYMTYDFHSHRYVLTEKDVVEYMGIDLKEHNDNENARSMILRQVSLQIYNFIHSHNTATDWQDYIIAKTETGRRIIKEAMEQQLKYLLSVGDASILLDKTKRELWIDEMAKEILLTHIPEIGTSICFTGCFMARPPLDTEW